MKNRHDKSVSLPNEPIEAQIVSSQGKELLTTGEMALSLGVSRQTIDRARREGRLQGIPHGKGFAFRRTETLEVGVDLRKETNAAARAKFEGDRDARVIEMFEGNATVAEIVVATKVPIHTVLQLRQVWRASRDVEQKDRPTTCSCGSPSDPRVAMCIECFRRVPVPALTDAQVRLLRGQPPMPPESCECTGCGDVTPNTTANHLCLNCSHKLTVSTQNGTLVIMLGTIVLRTLSDVEVRSTRMFFATSTERAVNNEKTPDAIGAAEATEGLPRGEKLDAILRKHNLRDVK